MPTQGVQLYDMVFQNSQPLGDLVGKTKLAVVENRVQLCNLLRVWLSRLR